MGVFWGRGGVANGQDLNYVKDKAFLGKWLFDFVSINSCLYRSFISMLSFGYSEGIELWVLS